MAMSRKAVKEFIAKRVAKEFKDGDIVNLGIGLPTLVVNYIPEDVIVTVQAENGYTGADEAPAPGEEDPRVCNAGGMPAAVLPRAAFFGSDVSFGLIRGGHLDYTVLGALQVDSNANIANYMIPGKLVPGMGGAMDLVQGARHVIVAMEHTQKGAPKILENCTLPLTGMDVVDLIITEMGVMEPSDDGMILLEINPEFTVDEVKAATACKLIIPHGLKEMEV